MLCSANALEGFAIVATDGEMGTLGQFYFDDKQWLVRYIAVNTGNWLSERLVLISPRSVVSVDWGHKRLVVNLTRRQVENSPSIESDKPVSREMEAAHSDYYGYPYYWKSPLLRLVDERAPLTSRRAVAVTTTRQSSASAATATESRASVAITAEMPVISNGVHLRGTQEEGGYFIAAADGEIGHVEDFIVDDESWAIRYLTTETGNWWSGKKVLISPQWISSVDWAQRNVHVQFSREGVRQSPVYDSSVPLSRDYEAELHGHYGQPGYWLN